MSRSQFMSEFQSVGLTPMVYLKQWRMTLARVEALKGKRIKDIAQRFVYNSSEAFCRAFMSIYGVAPSKLIKHRVTEWLHFLGLMKKKFLCLVDFVRVFHILITQVIFV